MKGNRFWLWITAAALMALLVGLIVGRLVWGKADDRSLEQVQATGELRVGLDASFPPFEVLDEAGNVIGFDADLARAIAGGLGAEPVFVNIGFDGLYDALLARRVDVVISGLPYDPRWTQDVIYSQPYFNAGQVLVVRADNRDFERSTGTPTPELLAGRTVAVEWGSLGDMEARRLREAVEGMQTLPQPTAGDALKALADGQADAAIADAVSVYQFMGENKGVALVLERLTDEPYVIATRIKSRRLAEAIDQSLEALRGSGVLDELVAEWF